MATNPVATWWWSATDVPLGDGIGMGLRESDTAAEGRSSNAAITELKKPTAALNEMLIKKWFGDGVKLYE